MQSKSKVAVSLIAVVIALSGCAEENGSTMTSMETDISGYEIIDNPLEHFGAMTTLNNVRPDGELLPLQDVEIMLDTINAEGNRLLIERGVRKAGTRVGIHVHQYGGHTCVIEGTITDFAEGMEPMIFPEGTCYYMPPNKPMAAANLGDKDAILIDTFILPPDAEPIFILEPGYPGGPEEGTGN